MLFKKIKRYWMHIWKVSRKNFAGKYYTCKEKRIQVMAVSALVIIPLLICYGCSVNSDDNLQHDNKEDIIYVLSARAAWNDANEAMVTYITYTRIKEWKYTEKGWFGYELCVPEPPEVTEIVDGSNMLRVRPMSEECRRLSEKCVLSLGYQGNNLLCSNWDTGNLEKLDYNGVYEYLYQMKYQDRFPSNDYPTGIPAEDFENLIMEFLPVTAEQIRKWAVFDEEHQTYAWERLGCMNYAPNFFGTSLPEVVDVKENKNGTTTLTVEAVCDMVIYSDAVITHELTVQFAEDGSFQYLGNRILNDGIKNIPDYQYRIPVK